VGYGRSGLTSVRRAATAKLTHLWGAPREWTGSGSGFDRLRAPSCSNVARQRIRAVCSGPSMKGQGCLVLKGLQYMQGGLTAASRP